MFSEHCYKNGNLKYPKNSYFNIVRCKILIFKNVRTIVLDHEQLHAEHDLMTSSSSMMIMQQPGKFKLGRFDPETHRQGEAGAAGRSEE